MTWEMRGRARLAAVSGALLIGAFGIAGPGVPQTYA